MWNTYKNTKDRCYTDFVKDFHIFNPEEAFLQANEIIEQIKEEKFLSESTDVERNSYCVDADVLSYLTGYQYSEYMSYVMELLIIYCSKNKKTFASGQKWLENYYGVDIDSNKFGYYTQTEVSKSLLNMISDGSDIAEAIGLYWAKYALAFSFRPTEMGRGNKMVCYHLELTHSNELKEFRAICWSILISLSTNKKWLPKIFTIMDEYSRNIQGNPDYDVVNGEVEYVEKVLEALNSDQISFLKMLRRLLKNADAMNINYDNAWRKKFSGNQWMLYQLLENDFVASELEYEDYKKQREEKLVEYGKQLKIEDIKNWVTSANDLLSDKLLDRDTFTINQGIQQIVNQMDVDELQEFLKAYIEHGTNMNVRPWSILEKLNKLADSTALLLYIKESTFPQKDEWMFSFFETLPKEKVNVKYMEELLGYLRSDLDKSITSSSFRDLRMLDKFMIIDSNIYPVVCDIIYEKRNYNSFIAEMYLEGLFNDKIYSPNELLLLFNDNINLLQEIYFYMLERGQFTDYSGVFLLEFLMLGESWLQKYAELFWKVAEKHRDHDYHIYEALWETDDYIKYFDGIFYYAIDKREYRSLIKYEFSHVFARVKDSELGLFAGLSEDMKGYGKAVSKFQKENIVNVMTNEFPAGVSKKTYSQCVFIEEEGNDYKPTESFMQMMSKDEFYEVLRELVEFGISRYERDYKNTYDQTDLVLYQKYTYEDVCRLLNWEQNEVPLNIGGYKYDKKTKTFPVFINYDKAEDISDTTKYEDHFVPGFRDRLIAISKSGRSLQSEDVQNFLKAKERGIQVELFVRKNKDDKISKEFYYLGHMTASGNTKEFTMANTKKTAVEIEWILDVPVREDIYEYIINS